MLLNVGGAIDISPVYDKVNAILLIGQAGIGAGIAVADILSGRVTPSGKLTATWAKKYEDYPCAEDFTKGDIWNTEYKEDIFVGYRYFDRNRIKPMFPFGFGLSYTNFSTEVNDIIKSENTVTIKLSVMNKGDRFGGKEVVQIYARQPKNTKEKAEKSREEFPTFPCFKKMHSISSRLSVPKFNPFYRVKKIIASRILLK